MTETNVTSGIAVNGLDRQVGASWDALTQGQRRVAHFLIDHPDEAPFLTVRQVAERAGTSTATVVRFARTLGYEGYEVFVKDLQSHLTGRLSPKGRFAATLIDFENKVGNEGEPLATAFARDIENLSASLELNVPEDFEKAVNLLDGARIVYLLGRGLAKAPSEILSNRLPRLGIPVVELHHPAPSLYNAILPLTSDDLLVAATFRTPVEADVLHATTFARSRGAPVIALTDHPVSPLARLASVSLFARRGLVNQMASMAAATTLTGALAISLALRRKDKASEAYAAYEQLLGMAGEDLHDLGAFGRPELHVERGDDRDFGG